MPISRRRVYSALHCCCDPRRPRYGQPRGSPLAGSGLRHLRAAALRLPHLDTKWEHGSDLHRQPSPYEGETLLVELPCCELVGAMGFSPMTCRVRTGCSETLSYTPKESGGGERYCPAPGMTPGPV